MKDSIFTCRQIELADFDAMPIRLVNEMEFAVTPMQLFESFETEQDWEAWAPVIKKLSWTSPRPFTIGTTREVEMTDGSICAEEFIAWEPGQRMAFRFTSTTGSGLLALGEDYQVEATDQGCRLTWIMVLELSGFKAIAMRLFKPFMRRNQRRYLNTLKAMLETRYPAEA
jgi:hypothetical protein